MIDPDNIIIQTSNLPDVIKIKEVPKDDFEIYNLDDDKDYEKFIKAIEKDVRKSIEYKRFINYLRDYMGMNECSFLKGVTNKESFDIKIEIHHYPFTLRDIVEIVIKKRMYYREYMSVYMVSEEVTKLHYKLLVGLIPLSLTVHQLVHKGRLFIPVDKVLGRYSAFIDYYKPFCTPEQLDTIERIEKYTLENADILNTTIIEQNRVSYNIQNPNYQLPQFNKINDNMLQQIENIKNNNYMLPVANTTQIEDKERKIICPIYFDESIIKK